MAPFGELHILSVDDLVRSMLLAVVPNLTVASSSAIMALVVQTRVPSLCRGISEMAAENFELQ